MSTDNLNAIIELITKLLVLSETTKAGEIEKSKKSITEARIEIFKDKIAEQSSAHDRMQNKMFSIVGLLLTLGGLITYDIFKLNFPDTVLEYIIFVSSLLCLGGAAALIGYDYRSKKDWSVPIGPVEEEKLDRATTYEEALNIIHKDYKITYDDRGRSLDKKAKFLNGSFHLFVAGVILMIVLKIGG